MKMIAKFFLFSMILGALVGCGNSSNKREESTLLRSYRLIDDNRSDDAISLLTAELNSRDQEQPSGFDSSPEARDLRVALASAYAKKAGLTVREIAKSIDMARKIGDLKMHTHENANDTDNQLKDAANLFLTHIRTVQTILVIPRIKKEDTKYLAQAARILTSTPDLGPGDLIYSAIVKIVLVRAYLFEIEETRSMLPRIVKEEGQCVAKVSEFRDYLVRATKLLLSGYEDVAKAMPEQRAEIGKSMKLISLHSQNVAQMSTVGILLNSASTDSLKEIYRQLGLGSQTLECEPDVKEKSP